MYLKIYTDGASRGNPGEAASACVVYNSENEILEKHARYLGKATNNIAEYEGLLMGLKRAKELGATEVEIFADSELMVKHMRGEYKVKNEGLRPLYLKAQNLAMTFAKIKYNYIPRTKNKLADALANEALDQAAMVRE